MAKHNEAVAKTAEVFSNLAKQAETLLDNVVGDKGERISKSSLAKTLTDLNKCNPMVAMAVVDAYIAQRPDLQSNRGPGGGVGAKGERKIRSVSETAKIIQETTGQILDTVKPEDRMKTRELIAKVAAKVKMQEADCKNNVEKALHSRKDFLLLKGKYGGLRKIDPNTFHTSTTPTG